MDFLPTLFPISPGIPISISLKIIVSPGSNLLKTFFETRFILLVSPKYVVLFNGNYSTLLFYKQYSLPF